MKPRWLVWVLVPTMAIVSALATTTSVQAAIPDRSGFVLWNGFTVVASGTSPAVATVTTISPGRYRVTFPGLGISGGVVHVTAVNASPHWCQGESWSQSGTKEIVYVRCYKPGGTLDPSGFALLFARSSGTTTLNERYGYVDAEANGSINSQYNAAGMTNTVAVLGTGQWLVTFPYIQSDDPFTGSLQATAVNAASGARCKVAQWTSGLMETAQQVVVYCFDAAGAAFNTRFTLTFQYKTTLFGSWSPQYWGYQLSTMPFAVEGTAWNTTHAPNTITAAGPGLSFVTFPNIGHAPDTVLVTAHGPTSDFCGLSSVWVNSANNLLVRNVNCFTNAGISVSTGFLISTASTL